MSMLASQNEMLIVAGRSEINPYRSRSHPLSSVKSMRNQETRFIHVKQKKMSGKQKNDEQEPQ